MADKLDPKSRSWNMSRIRAKDTKPEMQVRRMLHAAGFRYRLHVKDLPGKPDIVLPKWKTVIFVHGCFWHHHEGCKNATTPKTRTEWWLRKFETNRKNDELAREKLEAEGWNVIAVWECEISQKTAIDSSLNIFITNGRATRKG
ncbi:DNA mismatch endonuclease Vsr [Chlorobium phaeovibrioides]|uniref:Very short patch repair endonuclease n=1 Tax=Chlorobium phaeovibrioides TaxID=1094 RepID=A0A3S0N954_CHLPH|nr:DNA mismatch endonuclease Vsr [Chlorobium phaeovibrioides]RTY35393.1 DNA mismatch endonuclease Vsr [Chlorobium phaeovibrioides]